MGTPDHVRDLARHLDRGRLLVSGPEYEKARRIWNGAVDHRPAVIVLARTPADVRATVRAARHHDMPLSVRGGGHDYAGRALRDGGVVVDLTGMREVRVDMAAGTATVGGGATIRDVVTATAPYGLAPVAGTAGPVGLTGFTLGGGYGPLAGRAGLALDNLLAAEVVLADGRLVTADAEHEPELYWALRGGGGNFGVVTSMRLRLHPVPRFLSGIILFPWSRATTVWAGLREVLATAPDELTVQSGLTVTGDDTPVMFVAPTWSGEEAPGEKAIDELRALGPALVDQVTPLTYPELLRLLDPFVVAGDNYTIRTRNIPDYTPEAVEALVHAGNTITSPRSSIPVHHFHGAATRVPVESTAFGLRQRHFLVEIVAGWKQGDATAWADATSAALRPHSLPGGYPNLLGPDQHEQIRHAYGPNTARLLAAKARYDPDRVFTATPLPLG